MEGVPLIHGTTPGERNQASNDGTDKDETADHIDAGELLLPSVFALILGVQEDEEACKCHWKSQTEPL